MCKVHGGSIGHVRRKAAERWELAKAERKLVRRLGRPLTAAEFAYLSGDMPAFRREVGRQLAQVGTDAQIALVRLRNSLET